MSVDPWEKWKGLKWADVYDYWKTWSIDFPSVLREPFQVEKIYVPHKGREWFYGYDWILKSRYEQRINYIIENSTSFLLFGDALNKRTLHTVEMLAYTKDEEERVAIWIYAFLHELPERCLRGESHRITSMVMQQAKVFLSERFYFWHYAMKKLLPDIYFGYGMFEHTEFKSFEPLVDLAMATAFMILSEYAPVLYNSDKEGAIPYNEGRIRLGD